MIKTDVSVLYKTKLCKKFSANGYCPYGMRCQFIHEFPGEGDAEKKSQPPQPAAENSSAGPPLQIDKVVSFNPSAGFVKPAEPQSASEVANDPSKEEVQPATTKAEKPLSLSSAALNQIQAFKPAPVSQTKKSIIGTVAAGAVLAASGTGGFGNKQASMAFSLPNIIYKDILVHCIHVSIQE